MKCPGQDSRYWKPGAIFEVSCTKCGSVVEFFKDDTSRKCEKCGHRFPNPRIDFGCAAYCEFAEQCLGTLPSELRESRLKDRVAVEMKRYFNRDFKRIGHAGRVARYAERIGRETAGNLAVILPAAYLHDIGIHEAERKHGSTAAEYQEMEGPPVARSILIGLGARPELIDEVCDIVGHHHHPRPQETLNFAAVYDADMIVNIEERRKENPIEPEDVRRIVSRAFLSESGRRMAVEVLLQVAGAEGKEEI